MTTPLNPPLKPALVNPKDINKLIITGPSKLSGHVHLSGSKNSSLSILAATLCCSGTTRLHNMPNLLSDVRTMGSILGSLGAQVQVLEDQMIVNTDNVAGCVEPCEEKVREIRGGFFVIGALLGRFGEACVALPGGCDIGSRPVDLYIRGLCALGALVEMRDGKVKARVANGRRLVGGKFHLDYPSVGATQTLMMAASLADGVTVLLNVAKEPEVIDLARFLVRSGACVEGQGTNRLIIKGKHQLKGPEFIVSPDRIEAGTFMLAAAITRSCITMSPVIPSHILSLTGKLLNIGCRITRVSQNSLEVSAVSASGRTNLQAFNFRTGPFPGFPTDLQPQTMAMLTTCNGLSTVEESVFDSRMGHVRELQKLGARIEVLGSTALVYGKERGSALHGSPVVATDLRGGAALILAGLAAEGTTEVAGTAHVFRGYENIDKKLMLLGADVRRSTSSQNSR